MAKSFEVHVIAERCKECGLCIAFCPRGVFERGSKANTRGFKPPVPVRVVSCVGCRSCEYMCPDFSIFVVETEGKPRGVIHWSDHVEVVGAG